MQYCFKFKKVVDTTPAPLTEEDATFLTLLGFEPSYVDGAYWVRYE